jgi:alpha-glucosidase (family GH31 glycosyl hydrolase)
LTPDLLRMEWRAAPDQAFEDGQTLVVWNRRLPVPPFNYTPPLPGSSTAFSIETEGFHLEGDAAAPRHALSVRLKRRSLWGANASTWTPRSSTAGNLFGTFRTWDTLDGPQNMNCSEHSPWVTTHEPEHCTFGLISKAGWATVDDARSPVLQGGWVAAQSRGTCPALAVMAASPPVPCFEVQNHQNAADCAGAGCCWLPHPNGTDPVTPTLQGYTMVDGAVGYAYDPSLPQPNGTAALQLWYSALKRDHWATTDAAAARAAKYSLLSTLGFVPLPPSAAAVGSGSIVGAADSGGACATNGCHSAFDPTLSCQCDPGCRSWGNCCADYDDVCNEQLALFYSASRADHFSSTNNCSGCAGQGYSELGLQGYLLPAAAGAAADGTVALTWWWSASAGDNVLAPSRGTQRCVQRGGNVDTYLFAHGARYSAALRDYTRVAGRVPVPRRHQLGVSWSRWGQAGLACDWCRMDQNETVSAVTALANTSLPFPLDTFVFDMNWHLKVTGWTGYTWDTDWYPDHIALLRWLHGRGLYTGANLHDAQGVQPAEARYAAAAAAVGVDDNRTIDFHISNQTFATALQDAVLAPLEREGLDLWWTDWQQGLGGADAGASSLGLGTLDVVGLNPTIWLNHLRFTNFSRGGARSGDGGSSSARRGAIHSRYGGLSNHRYATGFGGDVRQSWESLRAMVFTTVTASNVAFPYWAQEIMHAGPQFEQAQLFARVVQFGAWSPVYTNWGNPNANDNLWAFPPPFARAMQRALAQRAMLLPLRYTLAREAHDTAVGLLRPMYYSFPFEADAYDATRQQYMLGADVLVAPAVAPLSCGDTCAGGRASQRVWLPPLGATGASAWIAFASIGGAAFAQGAAPAPGTDPFTPPVFRAGQWLSANASVDEVPAFVRAGTLLPMLPYERAVAHGSASRQYDALELWLYPGGAVGGASLYEDDGLSDGYLGGAFLNTSLSYTRTAQLLTLTLEPASGGLFDALPVQRSLTLRLLEAADPAMGVVDPVSLTVTIDGASVPGAAWARQPGSRYIGSAVVVQLPPVPPLSTIVVVIQF